MDHPDVIAGKVDPATVPVPGKVLVRALERAMSVFQINHRIPPDLPKLVRNVYDVEEDIEATYRRAECGRALGDHGRPVGRPGRAGGPSGDCR